MKPVRNSAKAIIIKDGQLLLTKNEDDQGYFYLFPGGGQEKFEELKDTVARECMEEVGQPVQVIDLVYVREYIGKNYEFVEWDSDAHQVEFYFLCDLLTSKTEINMKGTNPDSDQIGVEWIEINQLDEIRLYPKAVGQMIMQKRDFPKYLGDVN